MIFVVMGRGVLVPKRLINVIYERKRHVRGGGAGGEFPMRNRGMTPTIRIAILFRLERDVVLLAGVIVSPGFDAQPSRLIGRLRSRLYNTRVVPYCIRGHCW